MLTNDQAKAAALDDIERHLASVGSKDWKPCRDRHKLISDRVWWRLVSAAKEGKPRQEILAKAVRTARKMAEENLPAIPSPSYIATGGQQAHANLNFLGHIEELFEDVGLLRDYASTIDEPTGKRKIKNPVMFGQQALLRLKILETQIKGLAEAYSYERLREFFRIFTEEVKKEDPEVAIRIMARVAKVNDEFGITIHAKVS